MIPLYVIISILFTHWVFDFFLQSEEMGKNKSKSNFVLSEHVLIYSAGLFVLSFCIFNSSDSVIWAKDGAIIWVVINSGLHFFTDYITSRATSALYKEERYHEFFTIIGADQFIHYVTLFGTYHLIKS